MPRQPGRPQPPGRGAKRPRPRPRPGEEPAVVRARLAAAGEALRILAGPAPDAVELARGVHARTDRAIEQVHAASGDGDRLACREGCTYCCTFPVAASAPEILAIAAFVRDRFDEGRQAALAARVDAHIAATDGMSMARRERVRPDCPFLEGGRCAVYEVRPIACRGYSSFDVGRCRADYQYPGAGIEIPANPRREQIHGAIREGLAVACRSAAVDHRLLELARAYKIAAADPTLAPTWTARPDAFDPATGARVFPGPWSADLDQKFEEVYREAVERLEAEGAGVGRASTRPPT